MWNLSVCRQPNYTVELNRSYLVNGDASYTIPGPNLGMIDCKANCSANCSCVAYTTLLGNWTGCRFWTTIANFTPTDMENSDQVYILSPKPSQTAETVPIRENSTTQSGKTKWLWIAIAIAIGAIALLVIFFCMLCYLHRRRIIVLQAHDVSVFSYECITTATNNFSLESKLGEGGFGPVYKGKLPTGQEIAVKRLSRNSGQGIIEFKNELILISKLQRTNLVKPLGCCIFGEERMLIYEYMPNKSLDYLFDFSFSPMNIYNYLLSKLLDWNKRFNIIKGIVQGLIYLHKYPRLKVIYRDLKASNMLLDESINPKISDFGMARIFNKMNEKQILIEFGYMSPKYAMEGAFSIKSDVCSFSVLMLEIVSGRRNNSFNQFDLVLNLVGYAWDLWKEDKGLDLVDPTISDSFVANQVLRCIHVSLLCVEEGVVDRPTMLDMLSMLTNESTQLALPKKPAFSNERKPVGATIPKKEFEVHTTNKISISDMDPR
ncbi:hypothetical protein ACB092_11G041800 [Castanea dentata]